MTEASRRMDSWKRVREALEDRTWDFRTIAGISRQTGLDPDEIKKILEEHRSEIRFALSRDRETIYTLNSRPMKAREVISDLQAFASSAF